jgi:hypothetical protein
MRFIYQRVRWTVDVSSGSVNVYFRDQNLDPNLNPPVELNCSDNRCSLVFNHHFQLVWFDGQFLISFFSFFFFLFLTWVKENSSNLIY